MFGCKIVTSLSGPNPNQMKLLYRRASFALRFHTFIVHAALVPEPECAFERLHARFAHNFPRASANGNTYVPTPRSADAARSHGRVHAHGTLTPKQLCYLHVGQDRHGCLCAPLQRPRLPDHRLCQYVLPFWAHLPSSPFHPPLLGYLTLIACRTYCTHMQSSLSCIFFARNSPPLVALP